jgi:hypothetical protein
MVGETPWNHRGPPRLNHFQKTAADKSQRLNLDIDGWLRGIGLEHYVQTFRDNAIDADVLCDLTDEHLRELGLPAWGTAQVGPFALVRPSQPVASGRRSTPR